ncbi:glycosyltransferase BC10 [Capsicum galapagoense]
MFKYYILIPSLTLVITIPIIYFFFPPSIFPQRQIPISLPDELDDLSLFHKAIAADSTFLKKPTHNKHPSNKFRLGSTTLRRPKIAFLFLTNSDLHFQLLWNKFFNSSDPHLYNIYIHADPSVRITPPVGVFADRFIHSKRTQRSSPTLISATRRLLAHALLDDPDNAYFGLVSQHCIPLHSFNYFYSFLLDTQKLSRKMEFPSYIEILNESPSLLDRYNARGENVMEPEVSFEKFKVGSQFFVITRKHSLMVIKDSKLWRKFKKPCLKIESCYPEEHYFPTLLSMEDPDGCTRYTLTRVNWTDSVDGHPHTYHPPEVSPELIYKLRKSNSTNSTSSYMFARKFSPDCLEPLMEMADSIIFKD